MNICAFTGNMVADPELKQTTSGKSVCSFVVAVKRPRTKDITDFLKFVAWEGVAENITRFFRKGDPVALTASATTRDYETKEGKKQRVTEFIVNDFSFVSGKKDKTDEQAAPQYQPQNSGNFEEINPDDDLPF